MNQVMGTSVNRRDGFAKVTGTATYTAEQAVPGLVHGYLVTATIARGQIRAIATQAAEQAPGVLAVVTHQNRPQVFTPANDFRSSKLNEARLPLSDDQIYYSGQIIGLVVADTLERARDAAHRITVEYDIQTPLVNPHQVAYELLPDIEFNQGAADSEEDIALEATYT
ncbi:MAG: xanthine dehydrogenase family protein molybdopterin-binding subunit, partial [Cyanobacteria bacterium Co-bin8]|nr:xanthine dehydrogenase family protein molybdopterin-binding subunit [Cyanobacteria bacterium Co-bin8]